MTHLNEMVVMLYTEKETHIFGSTQQLNELVGNSVDMVPNLKVSPHVITNHF